MESCGNSARIGMGRQFSRLQVNGSRSAKQLLMSEWNQSEEQQMTSKRIADTMEALKLRVGELTTAQVWLR